MSPVVSSSLALFEDASALSHSCASAFLLHFLVSFVLFRGKCSLLAVKSPHLGAVSSLITGHFLFCKLAYAMLDSAT